MSLKRKYLVAFLFVVSSLVSLEIFHKILENKKSIIQSKIKKHQSYLIMDEWRRNSDNLTRTARAYVVTGESRFRESFQKAVESRADFSIKKLNFLRKAEDKFHSNFRILRPLTRDMKLIEKAKHESNHLLNLEEKAIHAMIGFFQDKKNRYVIKGSPDQEMAIKLLYGQEYRRSKRNLIYFLMEFFNSVERKVEQEIDFYKVKNRRSFIFLGAVLILFVLLMSISLFLVINSLEQKSNKEESVNSSLFSKRFWRAGRPFILFSLLIVLVVASTGYWLYLELVFVGEVQFKQNMNNNLDIVNDAVVNWIDQTNQITTSLSKSLEANIKTRDLHLEVQGGFHEELKKTGLLNSHHFDEYVVTDPDLVVASSNRTGLIGRRFGISDMILDRLKKFPYWNISFPKREMKPSDSLLDEKILFASALKKGKMGFLFFLISPKKNLAHIINHDFYQTAEIYMVSSQGNFVTTSRWSDELVQKGWLKSGMKSIIGIRVSENTEDPKASLSHPVNEMIHGRVPGTNRYKNENGIARYKNYEGTRVFGNWRWNNLYQFGLVIEISRMELYLLRKVFIAQTSVGMILISTLILLFTIIFIKNRMQMAMINSKLNNSYRTIKNQNDKMAEDLLLGQKVQTDMLPEKIKGQGFELDAYLKPAQMVSGDFYDFSFLDNKKKIYFCLGDVSGKGVGAALFMSMTKVSLNKTLNSNPNMQAMDLVSILNKELSRNNTSCMFVTLIVCILDIETGMVHITNAGHNSPYIRKASGELILLDQVDGPMVGTFEEISFKQQSIKLDHGDILISYTDGITDAQNLNKDFYKEERLEKVLREKQFSSSLHVINAITHDVMNFIGKQDQFDDITIISLRYS